MTLVKNQDTQCLLMVDLQHGDQVYINFNDFFDLGKFNFNLINITDRIIY